MRTPDQRGPFGRWLKRVREERYATQKAARDDMRRLAGLAIGESEYAQWESGSRTPKADNPKVLRLYEFFGSRPEEETETPPGGDQTALLAALAAQTAALTELTTALRDRDGLVADLLRALAEVQAEQSVQVQANSGRIESLAVVLARLVELGAPASSTPETRRETAG